eukprot:CAMPEP_0185167018 /NCGR_PEP_ID=MMETSP1139-20130426/13579_1 /TAXON_ID=298111 /ORGANISM="Pavlova sp., Strain CCMP459" /LENGTH=357 /DNA_ID=CAMNT_0027732487 /DNA_START=13 /DNA_END=1086 /DNA_ORIENTATION=-
MASRCAAWPPWRVTLILAAAAAVPHVNAHAVMPAAVGPLELRLPPRPRTTTPRDLFAVGDVHGDVRALKRALATARVTGEDGRWAAGDAVMVQTGDILDRHDDDLDAFLFLRRLRRQARAVGGEVVWLTGNHEYLNLAGEFTYVTPGAYAPFDRLLRPWRQRTAEWAAEHVPDAPTHQASRLAALAPGGVVARAMAAPVALTYAGTLLVHGGVRASHVEHLARWNTEVMAWMRGEGPLPALALGRSDAPIWTRVYSQPGDGTTPPLHTCAELEAVLDATRCERMVVGHTPQETGCNCACGGRVWRIDTGMSELYGGTAEVLHISGETGEVRTCRADATGHWSVDPGKRDVLDSMSHS